MGIEEANSGRCPGWRLSGSAGRNAEVSEGDLVVAGFRGRGARSLRTARLFPIGDRYTQAASREATRVVVRNRFVLELQELQNAGRSSPTAFPH